MAREAEERKRREEEAQFMAEQQRLRDEAQRVEQEKEAQERAKAEQEENERLQKQASDFIVVRVSSRLITTGERLQVCSSVQFNPSRTVLCGSLTVISGSNQKPCSSAPRTAVIISCKYCTLCKPSNFPLSNRNPSDPRSQ